MSTAEPAWRTGGRHCGAVRFDVALPDRVEPFDGRTRDVDSAALAQLSRGQG